MDLVPGVGNDLGASVESTSIASSLLGFEGGFERRDRSRDRLRLRAIACLSTAMLLDEASDGADPSAEDGISLLSASSISVRRRLFTPLYVAPKEDNGGLWHRRCSQEASLSSYGVESARNRARFMSVC